MCAFNNAIVKQTEGLTMGLIDICINKLNIDLELFRRDSKQNEQPGSHVNTTAVGQRADSMANHYMHSVITQIIYRLGIESTITRLVCFGLDFNNVFLYANHTNHMSVNVKQESSY